VLSLLALKDLIEHSPVRKKRYRWAGLYILPKIMDNPPHPLTPLQAADVWAFEARKERNGRTFIALAHGLEQLGNPHARC
jgi:hypothetical protein